jgi:hypothetical protein
MGWWLVSYNRGQYFERLTQVCREDIFLDTIRALFFVETASGTGRSNIAGESTSRTESRSFCTRILWLNTPFYYSLGSLFPLRGRSSIESKIVAWLRSCEIYRCTQHRRSQPRFLPFPNVFCIPSLKQSMLNCSRLHSTSALTVRPLSWARLRSHSASCGRRLNMIRSFFMKSSYPYTLASDVYGIKEG